jgi:LuxR family quorum sensing-dependent transcriptional regulator
VARQRGELTEREREVLALAADGKTAKEMAQALGISVRSVEGRMTTAVRVLGAKNRSHAVAIALRNKLIE